MFNFGGNKFADRDPQNYINSLLGYKSKIQLSPHGEKINDITSEDIVQIANLLFELGQQPLSEFRPAIEAPLIKRRNDITNIPTQEDLLAVLHSTVSDRLIYQDIINSIIRNYLTDPYTFTIPDSVSDTREFILKNQFIIENGMRELIDLSSHYSSEEKFLSHLKRENLYSLRRSNIAYFIFGHIYVNINERDKNNSLHYMLQAIFIAYATPFYDALLSIIDNYAETSLDNFLRN
mgnify:FL=1